MVVWVLVGGDEWWCGCFRASCGRGWRGLQNGPERGALDVSGVVSLMEFEWRYEWSGGVGHCVLVGG